MITQSLILIVEEENSCLDLELGWDLLYFVEEYYVVWYVRANFFLMMGASPKV